ncbi:MAG: hypothetical protein ABIJ18_00070 [archaeon]
MRKISWKLYVFSLVVTIMIFVFGLSIGLVIEKERLQAVEEINLEQSIQMKSLQLQQFYLESGSVNCEAMNELFDVNMQGLFDSMNRVIEYNKKALIDSSLFEYQLRDYFLTEIQFLLFSDELDKQCGMDSVTVIYFYDENEQDVQGEVLDYLKKIFEERMLVFSFDSNFKEEPMIDVLMTSYDVTTFPTVIVNGKKFENGVGSDELKDYICSEFKDKPVECIIEQNI